MKKLYIAMGACAIIGLASCHSEKKEAAQNEAENAVEQEVPVEVIAEAVVDSLAAENPVIYTDSGLGYRIIKQTRGITPTPDNTVKVKYTGKHVDGSVFDSSNGEAVDFPLNRVIPGFSEGISLMPVGSTYELIIPGNLAYGAQGVPGVIQPDETLIFEVELVDIVQ